MEHDEDEMNTVCKFVSERLHPSLTPKLISLIQDFDKNRTSRSEFTISIQLLFAKKGQEDEEDVEDTELEEGEIRQDHLHGDPTICLADLAIRDGNSKKHPSIHIRVKAEDVSDKREPEKHVTNVVFNLEGKKKRILQPDPVERSLKKTRKSKRLLEERVTPSYRLIPEDEQSPVSDTVLNNNKCCLIRFDDLSGHKELTDYEVAMASCEDYMFEADMLMEALRSAVESAENVISGEMRMEDLGVKFYRCIEMLYQGDMSEIVREDHKKALPVILNRLKQQLNKVEVAREEWKPVWKQVFEDNTAKQRASTAQ